MKRYTLFIVGLFLCLGTTKAQSSVDTQIAVNDSKQDKTFVVIISNENYKHEEAYLLPEDTWHPGRSYQIRT